VWKVLEALSLVGKKPDGKERARKRMGETTEKKINFTNESFSDEGKGKVTFRQKRDVKKNARKRRIVLDKEGTKRKKRGTQFPPREQSFNG